MPLTKKFFSYIPPKNDVADETTKLQMLYGSISPVYFEDWLEAQSSEIKEAYANGNKIAEITAFFKASSEHKNSWQQIKTLIAAIQDWAVKNNIKDANKWTILIERLSNDPSYLAEVDVPKWFSRGKKALEKIYLLINYSDTISSHQKNHVISQLSSLPMNILCSPAVLSRIEDARLDLLNDWSSRLMNARLKIIQECALNYIRENRLCPHAGNEIHYVNAFRNYVADDLSIPAQADILAPQNLSWEMHLNPFAQIAKTAIHPATVTYQLTQTLLSPFKGDFSTAKLSELQNLGKELNLLGKDQYLLANCREEKSATSTSEREADEQTLCNWIFKEGEDDNGDFVYTPYPQGDIEFIIQCTLTARLLHAGYFSENTITPIKVDDKHQLILVPEDISASWIQPNETKKPPKRLDKFWDKFLEGNPQYYNHPQIILHLCNSSFRQRIDNLSEIIFAQNIFQSTSNNFSNHLENNLLKFSKGLRLSFLHAVKNHLPKLDITIFPFITYLPENEARMKFLELVDKSKLAAITYPQLEKILLALPEEFRLPFLCSIKSHLPYLTDIEKSLSLTEYLPQDETRLKFLALIVGKDKLVNISLETSWKFINYLREEDYIEFLKLLGNFVNFLFCLPPDKQFPFLERNQNICLGLMHDFLDFEKIRKHFLKTKDIERYIKFLSLPGVKDRLAALVKVDERLQHYYVAATLLSLPEEERFPYLENNLDKWVNSINKWDDLITVGIGLPPHIENRVFLKLIGVNKLIPLIKSADDLNRTLSLLEKEGRLSFIQNNWHQWPDLKFNSWDIESIIQKFAPEERIKFLDLVGKDKLASAIDTVWRLKEILNDLPEKQRFPFLQSQDKWVQKLIYGIPDSIASSHSEEEYFVSLRQHLDSHFPYQIGSVDITTNFTVLIQCLPEKDRFLFLKNNLRPWVLTQKGFIEIIKCLPKEEWAKFFEFVGVTATILFNTNNTYPSSIETALQALSPETRLLFLQSFGENLSTLINKDHLLFFAIAELLRQEDYVTFFQFAHGNGFDIHTQPHNLHYFLLRLPKKACWPFLQQQALIGNITTENIKDIIQTLANAYTIDRVTLQSFLNIKEIQSIIFNCDFKNFFIPRDVNYLTNSVSQRKAIEGSIDVLEEKANSLTEKSPEKKEAILELVAQFREETHKYFSHANLNNKESAEDYLARCKEFTRQTDVPFEGRIDAYREEYSFSEIINRILVTITTVLSAFTLLAVPSMRYTFLGKTESRVFTENVLEEVEKIGRNIPAP